MWDDKVKRQVKKKLSGVKTGVKQLKKAKTSPPSVKKSTEVNITKLTPAEKQRPNLSSGSHFHKQEKGESKELLQDQVNEGEGELTILCIARPQQQIIKIKSQHNKHPPRCKDLLSVRVKMN